MITPLSRPDVLAKAIALREEAADGVQEWGHTSFENERLQIEYLLRQGQLQAAHNKAQMLLERAKATVPKAYDGADFDLAMAHSLLGLVLRNVGQFPAALNLLSTAQKLFEAINDERGQRMASITLNEQGSCYHNLGHLENAATKYEEAIDSLSNLGDLRSLAASKGNLATLRMSQGRYADAIAGHKNVLDIFNQLNEPLMVATAWHQIGHAYAEASDSEAAEAAYYESLKTSSRLDNKFIQAKTLTQLGLLYRQKNRLEEAVVFHRQAAEIDAELGDLKEEAKDHQNIANIFCQLRRYDEAQEEILRAIECYKPFDAADSVWLSFDILHEIETVNGNPTAARAAWQQARDAYLAYRRQGGYAKYGGGKLVDQVLGLLVQQQGDEVQSLFAELTNDLEVPDSIKQLIQAMVAILNGSRAPALADDLALSYADAAEVLFFMERLAS